MAHYILLLKHSVFYSKYQLLIPTFIASYVFVVFFFFFSLYVKYIIKRKAGYRL